MANKSNRVIFHIDVNSAYLSWEAVYRLQHGETIDLREIPSAIGGDPVSRHGIVLAKSIPAKKYNIVTGESLFSALQKYPKLFVAPPRHDLYLKCSNAMVNIIKDYTPSIERYSIDECFLDFTSMDNLYPDTMKLACTIKDRIKTELGFTVNIGISNNKLLAKMASDFKKPDKIHTLFPNEIKDKMWPLPVEDLFMVGKATLPKLHKLNIFTIEDLASCDISILKEKFKSHGITMWNYANGIESTNVTNSNHIDMKSIGNSTTTSSDVVDKNTAHIILLSLCETVCMRLRNSGNCCNLVSVSIKTSSFTSYSHQRKLNSATDCTSKIVNIIYELFDEVWKNEPLRLLGVSVSKLTTNDFNQLSLFDDTDTKKSKAIDTTIDNLRLKFGSTSIVRGVFINSSIKPLIGGIDEEDNTPTMSTKL